MSDPTDHSAGSAPTPTALVVLAWLLVLLPLAYGLWQTIDKATALFSG